MIYKEYQDTFTYYKNYRIKTSKKTLTSSNSTINKLENNKKDYIINSLYIKKFIILNNDY